MRLWTSATRYPLEPDSGAPCPPAEPLALSLSLAPPWLEERASPPPCAEPEVEPEPASGAEPLCALASAAGLPSAALAGWGEGVSLDCEGEGSAPPGGAPPPR